VERLDLVVILAIKVSRVFLDSLDLEDLLELLEMRDEEALLESLVIPVLLAPLADLALQVLLVPTVITALGETKELLECVVLKESLECVDRLDPIFDVGGSMFAVFVMVMNHLANFVALLPNVMLSEILITVLLMDLLLITKTPESLSWPSI